MNKRHPSPQVGGTLRNDKLPFLLRERGTEGVRQKNMTIKTHLK